MFGYTPSLPPTLMEGQPLNMPVVFFDDFLTAGYTVNDAADAQAKFSETANASAWLLTVIDGGTDNGESIVISDDEPGGVLAITTNDADNDACELQLNGEAFKVQSGKDLIFEARFKLNDVDTADWFLGLATTDTTVLAGTTESLGFRCPDGTGDIDYVCEDNSTETTGDTGIDLADDTFVTVRLEVRSNERVKFFVNGALVGTSTTNIPDGDAVTPTMCVRNASGAASTLEVDYFFVAQER